MEHTKKRLWLKILCIVLAVFIAIAAALGITVACLWGNEIATVASFKQLRERNDANEEGSVYRMDVKRSLYPFRRCQFL